MASRRERSCKWSRSLNKIQYLVSGLTDLFLDPRPKLIVNRRDLFAAIATALC